MVVSKVDALVEMVRAYDSQKIKKANQIGQILSKNIREDSEEGLYSAYIGVNRETKQLFPQNVRKKEAVTVSGCNTGVELRLDEDIYEIAVADGTVAIRRKA